MFSGIAIYLIFICAVSKEGRSHFRSQPVFPHLQLDKQDSFKDIEKEGKSSNFEQNLSREKVVLNVKLDGIEDTKTNEEQQPKEDEEKEVSDTKRNIIAIDQITVENDLQQKEAKIIDLLDQVLQAEEDNYIENVSLNEENVEDKNMVPIPVIVDPIPQRKSFSDLSDAGSDASFGNQVLSKYDVIVQVHREDLPKVNEDIEKEANIIDNNKTEEHEEVTAFNDSETNSRTDESGYSDTIDKSALNDSTEDARAEDIPYIPEPPPFDENYFSTSYFKTSYSILPTPKRLIETEEENKPRISVESNSSKDDGTIIFGSDRQMSFMSKLTNIYKNKIEGKDEDNSKRSHSVGDMKAAINFAIPERPAIFKELNKEILDSTPILRPVNNTEEDTVDIDNDSSMSREDLRSKLQNIYSTGGPKPVKPKLEKSNAPTPEEAYDRDASSDSDSKLPKIEKNDTLKRQKDKFSEVLNSFRLSINKDDVV